MILKSYNNLLYLYYRFLIFLTEWAGIKINQACLLKNQDISLVLQFRDPLFKAEKIQSWQVAMSETESDSKIGESKNVLNDINSTYQEG